MDTNGKNPYKADLENIEDHRKQAIARVAELENEIQRTRESAAKLAGMAEVLGRMSALYEQANGGEEAKRPRGRPRRTETPTLVNKE